MMEATSAAARSASSFTTTWSNSPAAATSVCAMLRRRAMASSDSVPRPRSRWLSSAILGGAMKTAVASGRALRTARAPTSSISRITSSPRASLPSTAAPRANAARAMKKYSRPSCSPGRAARVVADTEVTTCASRCLTRAMTVPFPAPDGPEITNTAGMSASEAGEQLGALALRETTDGLARADAALLHDARRLHAPALGRSHEKVDHLGGEQEVGRSDEDVADARVAALEVGLQSGPAAAHLVGPAERVHALVERTLGGRVGLPEGDGHRAEVYVATARACNAVLTSTQSDTVPSSPLFRVGMLARLLASKGGRMTHTGTSNPR